MHHFDPYLFGGVFLAYSDLYIILWKALQAIEFYVRTGKWQTLFRVYHSDENLFTLVCAFCSAILVYHKLEHKRIGTITANIVYRLTRFKWTEANVRLSDSLLVYVRKCGLIKSVCMPADTSLYCIYSTENATHCIGYWKCEQRWNGWALRLYGRKFKLQLYRLAVIIETSSNNIYWLSRADVVCNVRWPIRFRTFSSAGTTHENNGNHCFLDILQRDNYRSHCPHRIIRWKSNEAPFVRASEYSDCFWHAQHVGSVVVVVSSYKQRHNGLPFLSLYASTVIEPEITLFWNLHMKQNIISSKIKSWVHIKVCRWRFAVTYQTFS